MDSDVALDRSSGIESRRGRDEAGELNVGAGVR
jgi:hypothetical protein